MQHLPKFSVVLIFCKIIRSQRERDGGGKGGEKKVGQKEKEKEEKNGDNDDNDWKTRRRRSRREQEQRGVYDVSTYTMNYGTKKMLKSGEIVLPDKNTPMEYQEPKDSH